MCIRDSCYTDGSKTNNRTGLVYSINNNLYSNRHRNSASVFTRELRAIYLTLHILSNPCLLVQPTIIVSDSIAALTTIANTNSDHPGESEFAPKPRFQGPNSLPRHVYKFQSPIFMYITGNVVYQAMFLISQIFISSAIISLHIN